MIPYFLNIYLLHLLTLNNEQFWIINNGFRVGNSKIKVGISNFKEKNPQILLNKKSQNGTMTLP